MEMGIPIDLAHRDSDAPLTKDGHLTLHGQGPQVSIAASLHVDAAQNSFDELRHRAEKGEVVV